MNIALPRLWELNAFLTLRKALHSEAITREDLLHNISQAIGSLIESHARMQVWYIAWSALLLLCCRSGRVCGQYVRDRPPACRTNVWSLQHLWVPCRHCGYSFSGFYRRKDWEFYCRFPSHCCPLHPGHDCVEHLLHKPTTILIQLLRKPVASSSSMYVNAFKPLWRKVMHIPRLLARHIFDYCPYTATRALQTMLQVLESKFWTAVCDQSSQKYRYACPVAAAKTCLSAFCDYDTVRIHYWLTSDWEDNNIWYAVWYQGELVILIPYNLIRH